MLLNQGYLEIYKTLIQTTELQHGYQEFIKLFRFLRVALEKEFPEYTFSGNIVENAMDYSYFQFTNEHLKILGLKVVVAFVHKDFCFEVWISGFNRKVQCQYYERLKDQSLPFILNETPSSVDYILKNSLDKEMDLHHGEKLIAEIKKAAMAMTTYIDEIEL